MAASEFKNRVVMITGAAGNLGRAISAKFAAQSARLVLVDYSLPVVRDAAEELNVPRSRCLTAAGDLGKIKDADAVIAKAVRKFDRIDCLIHTVGGFAMGEGMHTVDDLSRYERMMYLNAQTTYVMLARVGRHMVEAGTPGAMVAILARSGLRGAKGMAEYTAGKAAAERIVQSAAEELKPYNIRVNGVMPSTIDTPLNRRDMPNADFSRWVTPDQLANVIMFLCSDAASAITGDSIAVYNKA
jgi:NAD(P)-dependent dehydrogenase (short-subunit alcohol dehydrogenase family)